MTTLFALTDFAAAWWKAALGLVIGVALCWPVASCDGARKERARAEAAQAKATVQAERRATQADEAHREAADNRATALEGAIDNASDGNAVSGVLDELRRRQRR